MPKSTLTRNDKQKADRLLKILNIAEKIKVNIDKQMLDEYRTKLNAILQFPSQDEATEINADTQEQFDRDTKKYLLLSEQLIHEKEVLTAISRVIAKQYEVINHLYQKHVVAFEEAKRKILESKIEDAKLKKCVDDLGKILERVNVLLIQPEGWNSNTDEMIKYFTYLTENAAPKLINEFQTMNALEKQLIEDIKRVLPQEVSEDKKKVAPVVIQRDEPKPVIRASTSMSPTQRYADFIIRNDIAAMPALVELLLTPDIHEALQQHWDVKHNDLPDEDDIVDLRNALANAQSVQQARKILMGTFEGITEPMLMKTSLHQNGGEDKLRGDARAQVFLHDPNITAMPALTHLFTADKGAVRDALSKHLRRASTPMPDSKMLRDRLADPVIQDNASLRKVFTDPGGVFGDSLPVNTVETLKDDQVQRGNQLRGQARYEKLLADNAILLKTMPHVQNELMLPDVKEILIKFWGSHPAPDYAKAIVNLRDNLSRMDLDKPIDIRAAFTAPNVFGPIPGLDTTLQTHITQTKDANELRDEARDSKFRSDEKSAIVHREDYFQQVTDIKKALRKVKTTDTEKLTLLADQARTLHSTLSHDHELQEPLHEILETLGNPTTHESPIVITDRAAFKKAAKHAKTATSQLEKSLGKIVDDKLKKPDRGTVAYLDMATRYRDEAELHLGSISKQDAEEADRILIACKKMRDDLDLAEGALLMKQKKKSTKKTIPFHLTAKTSSRLDSKLENIRNARKLLNETIQKIEEAKALGPVRTVNCFSDDCEVLAPGTADTVIDQKIQDFMGSTTPSGHFASGHDTSSRFDNGATRVNYMILQKTEIDPLTNTEKPVDAKFASVQGLKDGQYRSVLHHDRNDIEKLSEEDLFKLAVTETENFLAGMDDKQKAIILKGNIHPKLAEAICVYCEIVKHPRPIARMTLPKRTEAEKKAYIKRFEETLSKLGHDIYQGHATLGMQAKKVQKLQQATRTTPTQLPSAPHSTSKT